MHLVAPVLTEDNLWLQPDGTQQAHGFSPAPHIQVLPIILQGLFLKALTGILFFNPALSLFFLSICVWNRRDYSNMNLLSHFD